MRLRSRCGVAGSDHNGGKSVANDGCGFCSSVNAILAALAGAFVIVLGISELTERVVPVGLEAVSDEAVVGVDSKVTTPGQLGAVAGAFDMAGTQGVSFIDAGFELGLDGERDLEGERVTISSRRAPIAASMLAPGTG